MDARELLKDWPNGQLTSAEGIFQSPAWRLPVVYEGTPGVLVKAEGVPTDVLPLALTFDGEASVLGLVDSPYYPDLHLLWARRRELPPEVLLALVEKECGALFQMLEDATKKLVSVKGLADAAVRADDAALTFVRPDGQQMSFTLGITPSVLARFGTLDNLDVAHVAMRSMTRSARAVYAELALTADEVAALAVDDRFVLPPPEVARWRFVLPADETVRICASEEGALQFAQVVDETLPPVPPPCEVTVFQGARVIATGRVGSLGRQQAVRVVHVSGSTF